jgi:hypothetical protein
MKAPGTFAILAVFSFFGAVLAADELSLQPQVGLNFKVADDFTFGGWATMHSGPLLDQAEVLEIPFIDKGFTNWMAAPCFSVKLGNLDKIELAGGAELIIFSRQIGKDSLRKLDKDSLNASDMKILNAPDYFEIRPTGIITLSCPFGGMFNIQLVNRFERRIFRAPIQITGNGDGGLTRLRYISRVRLAVNPFSPLKASPYVLYEGYVQNLALNHLSGSGIGIALAPAAGLSLDISYRVRWMPDGLNLSEQQLGVDARYTFDFTK